MNRSMIRAALVGLCAAALAGCGDVGNTSRAGGEEPAVVLRIGTNDPQGRASQAVLDELSRQLDSVAEGRLAVEPVYEVARDTVSGWDQAVIEEVRRGELDGALVPARAFDVLGVTSLRALHAPFLVSSDGALERVVRDEEIVTLALEGLGDVGLTGLGLVPVSLRTVFSFGDPLLAPGDLAGGSFRVPRSETTWAWFEAMGAIPNDEWTDREWSQGVQNGDIRGAESSFGLAHSLPGPSVATGDVTPFPLIQVLFLADAVYDALAPDEQDALASAVSSTRDWYSEVRPTSSAAAAEFCAAGGRVVLAGRQAQEEFRAAGAPVYAELEKDDVSARLIRMIEAITADAEAGGPVEPCSPDAPTEPAAADPSVPSVFPEGTYRAQVTREELTAAGVPLDDAIGHAGTWTITFRSGEFFESNCLGTYVVEDARQVITLGSDRDCGTAADTVLFSAGWRLEGTRMTFTDVRSGHGSDRLTEALFGRTFEKIG